MNPTSLCILAPSNPKPAPIARSPCQGPTLNYPYTEFFLIFPGPILLGFARYQCFTQIPDNVGVSLGAEALADVGAPRKAWEAPGDTSETLAAGYGVIACLGFQVFRVEGVLFRALEFSVLTFRNSSHYPV